MLLIGYKRKGGIFFGNPIYIFDLAHFSRGKWVCLLSLSLLLIFLKYDLSFVIQFILNRFSIPLHSKVLLYKYFSTYKILPPVMKYLQRVTLNKHLVLIIQKANRLSSK